MDPGEECDDGNTNDNDGCGSDCRIERFERDYECGKGCLNTTIITVSVPLLQTNTITYSFSKSDCCLDGDDDCDDDDDSDQCTCEVDHFVMFDIPNCTEVVNVTGDPPSCVEGFNIPCNVAGDSECDEVGPCKSKFANFVGRPLKVDVTGNNCSVTIEFANNLTYKEAPFGIKSDKGGVGDCSNCTALVPDGCYEPPHVFPEFACWWNWSNTSCTASFNYSLLNANIVIVPKGPLNFLMPDALPGTDNTPVIFTTANQVVGHTTFWDCVASPWQAWNVDGEYANATMDMNKVCDDCNNNSIPDPLDIERGWSKDCNFNCVPDECDIANGHSEDNNTNMIPDECEEPLATASATDDPPSGLPGYITGGVLVALCCCFSIWALAWDAEECREDETEKECRERRRRGVWLFSSRATRPSSDKKPLLKKKSQGTRGPLSLGKAFRDSGGETDHSEHGHRKAQ